MSHAGPKTARYMPAWIWVVGSLVVLVAVVWVGGSVVASLIPHPDTRDNAASKALLPSSTPTPTPTSTPTPSAAISVAPQVPKTTTAISSGASTLTSDDVATIQSAISSDNESALTPYLPGSVIVSIGGGGSSGSMSPADAITTVQSTVGSASGWNFGLDATTLRNYRQGSYGAYFPSNAIVGRSSDGHVISLLPRGSNIATIFMITSDILLVSN